MVNHVIAAQTDEDANFTKKVIKTFFKSTRYKNNFSKKATWCICPHPYQPPPAQTRGPTRGPEWADLLILMDVQGLTSPLHRQARHGHQSLTVLPIICTLLRGHTAGSCLNGWCCIINTMQKCQSPAQPACRTPEVTLCEVCAKRSASTERLSALSGQSR